MTEANAREAMELPVPEPISIRAAKDQFHSLVSGVADGSYVLICRHSTPLAVLVPAGDFDRIAEAVRRDQGLAAVLRGRGLAVELWTTPKVLEVVLRLVEGEDR